MVHHFPLRRGDQPIPGHDAIVSEDSASVAFAVRGTNGFRRSAKLPAAVVLASLIGLVIAQYVIQIHVGQQWEEISELGEPARTLVTAIQLAFGLEAAGTRGFLLTGDAHYADGYAEARRRRDAAYQKLIALTKRLGPLAYEEVLRLGRLLDASEPLLDGLFSRSLARTEYVDQLSLQQRRFEAVTVSAHRIDDFIGIEIDKRTMAIRAQHRFGVALMTVLV